MDYCQTVYVSLYNKGQTNLCQWDEYIYYFFIRSKELLDVFGKIYIIYMFV